jgi:hypothetical protein
MATESRKMSLRGAVGVSLIVLVLLAVAFFFSSDPFPDSFRLNSYVSTSGQVSGTDITQGEGGHWHPFIPVVLYRYTVGGREFTGHRVQLQGPYFNYLKEAESYAQAFPTNGSMTVWYDPRRPASSVLFKTPIPAAVVFGVPALFAIATLPVLVVVWVKAIRGRSGKQQQDQGTTVRGWNTSQP